MDSEKQSLVSPAAAAGATKAGQEGEQTTTTTTTSSWGLRAGRFLCAAAIVYLALGLAGGLCRVDMSKWDLVAASSDGSGADWADRVRLSASSSSLSSSSSSSHRVPLEAHIMSKCPDARDCLQEMILPVMQRASGKVDFKLTYIGQAAENGTSVTCMHGDDECTGNMIELCAAHLYPDPKLHLGFAMCLSHDYHDIPQDELVSQCALEHSIDQKALGECILKDDGKFALGLLVDSVRRSADAKVRFSCTVRLDGKPRCIRDGGQWKDCEGGSEVTDILRDIDALYEA